MREESKRHLKMLVGVMGMVPLVSVLVAVIFPETFQLTEVHWHIRLAIAGFLGFGYCFGLMKWVFPNG